VRIPDPLERSRCGVAKGGFQDSPRKPSKVKKGEELRLQSI